MNGFPVPSLLIFLITSVMSVDAVWGGLYRWTDSEGNVFYSDSIPPANIRQGHTEINKGGIHLRTIPRAKTLEEFKKEQELERLRAQQIRLIEQQKAADQVLLRTFRSEDDLIMARDGKLEVIDVMVQVAKKNIRRQQEWLAGLRSDAANMERAGKPVSRNLKNGIDKTERSIQDAIDAISARDEQQDVIRASFDLDLLRFRQLRNLNNDEIREAARTLRPILHGIVTCPSAVECDRFWERANTFVREHASTEIESAGTNILVTAPPLDEADANLILCRVKDQEGEGASIFLELLCRTSLRGQQMCQRADAERFVEEFRAATLGKETVPTP